MLIYAPVPVNFKLRAFKSKPIFVPMPAESASGPPSLPPISCCSAADENTVSPRNGSDRNCLHVLWITGQMGLTRSTKRSRAFNEEPQTVPPTQPIRKPESSWPQLKDCKALNAEVLQLVDLVWPSPLPVISVINSSFFQSLFQTPKALRGSFSPHKTRQISQLRACFCAIRVRMYNVSSKIQHFKGYPV